MAAAAVKSLLRKQREPCNLLAKIFMQRHCTFILTNGPASEYDNNDTHTAGKSGFDATDVSHVHPQCTYSFLSEDSTYAALLWNILSKSSWNWTKIAVVGFEEFAILRLVSHLKVLDCSCSQDKDSWTLNESKMRVSVQAAGRGSYMQAAIPTNSSYSQFKTG
jgi:hypothetical protein